MAASDFSNGVNKTSRYLLMAVLFFAVLYFARALLIPMSFGLLLSAICYPLSKRLESKGWPRTVSVTVLIAVITLLFVLLLVLLGYETSLLAAKKDQITAYLAQLYADIRILLAESLGVKTELQGELFTSVAGNVGSAINSVLSATTSTLITLFLVPVFAALFLLHRGTFVTFFEYMAGPRYKNGIRSVLHESLESYFRFVKGNFFVYCIVGVLNSIGLLLLGIDHAILFGFVAAFMTIIPYIGIIISAALPISAALLTKDSWWYAAGVVGVFSLVQYLEANVIFPRIVGQQLNLSTWSVLVAMMVGTLVWGIAGMVLFVPFAGILNVFCIHIPELKPLSILLSRNSAK